MSTRKTRKAVTLVRDLAVGGFPARALKKAVWDAGTVADLESLQEKFQSTEVQNARTSDDQGFLKALTPEQRVAYTVSAFARRQRGVVLDEKRRWRFKRNVALLTVGMSLLP